jgi:hypothetical protein
VMDQPGPTGETAIVTCTGPLRRGLGSGGRDTPIEDGVGGGAVFAFKGSLEFADRREEILPGTDGNLSCGEVGGRRKPAAVVQRSARRAE